MGEASVGHLGESASSASLLTAIVQSSDDAIISTDLQGLVLTWNCGANHLLGYRSEEIISRPLSLISEERADDVGRHEARWRRKDGSVIDVEVTVSPLRDPEGRVFALSRIAREITSGNRVEGQLKQVANAVPEILFIANAAGENEYLNDRYFEYCGPVEGAERRRQRIHPEDRAGNTAQWEKAVRDGTEYHCEFRMRGKDGTYRWFVGRAKPLRGDDGKISRWFGSLADIDDRKRAEQEAHEARCRAEQADRAKDRFLAVLSHELRTPLAPVVMTVASLETREDLPPDVRQDLAMIKRNIDLETRLIDDLLDVTRIANGKLPLVQRCISIHSLVETVLDICRTDLIGKRIHLTRRLEAADECVWADASRLQQALWNVVKNSVKFTRSGGSVTVSTSNPQPGGLRIDVIDDGIGIDPQLLPQLFQPFRQGQQRERTVGGLGLGLAICKAIVELHGGTIRAESDGPGMGARFSIELPTTDPAVLRPSSDSGVGHPVAATHPVAASGPNGHGLVRVLLVEDHLDTLRTMRRLLVGMGYRVITAESAAEAIERSAAEPFDVIISDIGLPDASGNELLRRLREHHPHKPGIALSGYGMDEDVRASADAGFAMHLTKPIDVQQLHAAITRLLDRGR